MRDYKLEYYKDKANKHRWRLVAGNGEIVDSSNQGFSSKQACVNNIALVGSVFAIASNEGLV